MDTAVPSNAITAAPTVSGVCGKAISMQLRAERISPSPLSLSLSLPG